MLGLYLFANEWVSIKPLKVKLLAGEQKATEIKVWTFRGPSTREVGERVKRSSASRLQGLFVQPPSAVQDVVAEGE